MVWESNDYDVRVAVFGEPVSTHCEHWVLFAAADAAENKVTPLRRFLWRYGRDLANPRRRYKMLVELFEQSASVAEMPEKTAMIVFNSLPDPTEGTVLKRDILGIGPSSPRLAPPISTLGFLRLLTSDSLPEVPAPAQIEQRLEELTPSQASEVARYYDRHGNQLAPWKHSIENAIIKAIDRPAIGVDFPATLLAAVLKKRPELADSDTVARLSNEDLEALLSEQTSSPSFDCILQETLRRDFGASEDRVVTAWPVRIFGKAVDEKLTGRLHSSWLHSIPRHTPEILQSPWLDAVHSTAGLAAGLALLRNPRYLGKTTDELSRRLAELQDDVQGAERYNLQAFLLRAAIDESSSGSWSLIRSVLPELRIAVLRGGLPHAAHTMLSNDLPRFYAVGHWDLNKRILMSLSTLYRTCPNENAVRELHLSEDKEQLVLFGKQDDTRNLFVRLLDWF
jgi:hypothetical protein